MILFWIVVIALAILAYVLLDGFDLGVGILYAFARDEQRRRAMLATAASGVLLFAVALSGWGGFWALAVPQFLFISTLGFNFSNGFALGLAPFGASAGTASALFGTLQFLVAGLGGAAVSAFYDGTARAMTGVMCATPLIAVALYRWMKS